MAPPNVQLNDDSYVDDITPDGRFVVITSEASNLVSGDTNGHKDIFVIDRDDGSVERVTVDSNENQINDVTEFTGHLATISDDGRYVCFRNGSAQLVANDTNGEIDVFVRDRTAGTTERVSLTSGGIQIPMGAYSCQISGDGSVVIFESGDPGVVANDMNGVGDVFLKPFSPTGATVRVSITDDEMEADSFSGETIAVSDDGNLVSFISDATNLVSGDTNDTGDLFVRNISAGSTTRVSLTSTGQQVNGFSGGLISADGDFAAFVSNGTNVVPGDTNGNSDVFVRDLVNNTTELVSAKDNTNSFVTDSGANNVRISPDGRLVSFGSFSSQLSNPFTPRNGSSVFIRDRQTTRTILTDLTDDFQLPSKNGDSSLAMPAFPQLAASGVYAFSANADNLVPNDTNGFSDVFLTTFSAPPIPPSASAPDNSALCASLKNKLKKLKKKAKRLKKSGKVAAAKKLKKKIKKIKRQLKALGC